MNPCISHIIIPARLASTRLPRKLLLCETGKTLLQHTYEAASRAARPQGRLRRRRSRRNLRRRPRLRRTGRNDRSRGRPAAPTASPRSPGACQGVDIIVNVQGDEPELSGRVDRPGHPPAGRAAGGGDGHAGHADPQPAATGRPGLREGGFRRRRAGRCISAAAPSRVPASGTTGCWRPIRRISTSTWGCTPIAAIFCCNWPRCRNPRWSGSRSWSNCGRCRPAIRSWSAWSTSRPSASTRRRIIGRSWSGGGGALEDFTPRCEGAGGRQRHGTRREGTADKRG